jgi:hypothetical protein
MHTCPNCGTEMSIKWATCPRCGASQGAIHPMSLMLWFLAICTFPIYPIAGGSAALAAAAVSLVGPLLDPNGALWVLSILTVPVVAFYYGFKLEQRVAHVRAYRIARKILRYTTGAAVIAYVLTAQTGLSGGEIFGVIILVPIALFLVRLADWILGAGGPIDDSWETKSWYGLTPAMREYFVELKWNEAVIWGFPAGIIGFLIGNDTRILFGLFCWAFVTGSILGVKILIRLLGVGARAVGAANRGLGGAPRRILFGTGGGAIAGAALSQIIDHHVEIEAVILLAVLGFVGSLIAGAFIRRRAN